MPKKKKVASEESKISQSEIKINQVINSDIPLKVENSSEESETTIDPTLKKKQNKQLKIIFISMLIIIVILMIPFVFRELTSKFTFANIDFKTIKVGTNTVYFATIPVKDTTGKIVSYYNVTFKNDPRLLNSNISVDSNIQDEGIKFIQRNIVFLSIDPKMTACPDNGVSLFTLSSFLTDANLAVKSAYSNELYANESNSLYINCEHSREHTVIKVSSGKESIIKLNRTNCYEITYQGCDINKVTERFMLEILENYMNSTAQKSS